MKYLSKEENNKAFDNYFYAKNTNKNIAETAFIEKFKELFVSNSLTENDVNKYRDVVCFIFGPTRACYNKDKTAILICEMSSYFTLGATRNMSIVDINKKITYNLKYGHGYRKIKKYIESL